MMVYRVSPHPEPVPGEPIWSQEAIRIWTPRLGPTSMLLGYLLATDVERLGAFTTNQEALAASLGVMESKVTSALKRLHRFDMALVESQSIAIRLTVALPHSLPSRPGA